MLSKTNEKECVTYTYDENLEGYVTISYFKNTPTVQIRVPADDLLNIVGEYIRRKRIKVLQDLDTHHFI